MICESQVEYLDSLWCTNCERTYGLDLLSTLRVLVWAKSAVQKSVEGCPPRLQTQLKSAFIQMDQIVVATCEEIRHSGAK